MTQVRWRNDRISKDVDPETGRHIVNLPTVSGITRKQRDLLFAFEAGLIGTTRAVIRMNKRAAGEDPDAERGEPPYKIAVADTPEDVAAVYAALAS